MNITKTATATISVGIAIALSGCGGSTEVTQAPAAATSTPVSAPVAVPDSAPTTEKSSTFALRIGEPAQLTTNDVPMGSVTVVSVTSTTKNPATYSKSGPKNGMFWIVTVRYEAAAGLTKTWSTNPFDWQVSDADGTRYSPEYIGEKTLGSVELKAGQKNSGTVTFDAPATGSELFFQSGRGNESIAGLTLVSS